MIDSCLRKEISTIAPRWFELCDFTLDLWKVRQSRQHCIVCSVPPIVAHHASVPSAAQGTSQFGLLRGRHKLSDMRDESPMLVHRFLLASSPVEAYEQQHGPRSPIALDSLTSTLPSLQRFLAIWKRKSDQRGTEGCLSVWQEVQRSRQMLGRYRIRFWLLCPTCLVVTAMSGCVTLPLEQQEQRGKDASQKVTCIKGDDCDTKWGRALKWVSRNSQDNQTQGDSIIQTFTPTNQSAASNFLVNKVPLGSSVSEITITTGCDNLLGCVPNATQLRTSFDRFVMGDSNTP